MTFNKQELNRTIFIIREMAEGKTLKLSDGFTVGMGEDMSIGYLISHEDGSTTIGGLSTLSLCELNTLLNYHDVWGILP